MKTFFLHDAMREISSLEQMIARWEVRQSDNESKFSASYYSKMAEGLEALNAWIDSDLYRCS